MAVLSGKAYHWMAQMLNTIEQGAAWPKGTTQARAAFLAKDSMKQGDPLAYRILLILSAVYRRWAAVRLHHLGEWIDGWALPEIFAGVQGKGAEQAWYSTALLVEEARLRGINYTGGAADVWKCFDQIQRPMVYKLARMAGMSEKVLNAYERFQETLEVRNVVGGG